MKKIDVTKPDVSAMISNLLIVSAVAVALTPVLLGDRLVMIASEIASQGAILLQQVSISVQRLFS
ncbi:MAG TPA: hypothetical protein VK208_12990 [Pyrinomonadaceae bacterium]|jgi:hypothetical protein|nr:hypothetical protein [Pyrinomonadaceae bacterium]